MSFKLKLASFSSFKSPYILSVPVVGLSGSSAYSIYENADIIPATEHHYLARVQLEKETSKSKINGVEVDFSDNTKLKKTIDEDRQRLSGFYRKYSSKNINVNFSNDTTNGIDFFLHIKDKYSTNNLNNLWLENTHLNQLSIDRYGYEYDDNGTKKSNTTAKLHHIVKWRDIDLDKAVYGHPFNIPAISFRFFENSISKDEVAILINEDTSKYTLDNNSDKDVSKDWFVWLDKSILTLKLNYALQTYVFNQKAALLQSSIKPIVGDEAAGTSDKGNTTSEEQRTRWKTIQNNYEHLPEGYEDFAKNYISSFLDTSSSSENPSNTNWSSVVNSVVTDDNFIKTDDLNKIYNRFKNTNKNLDLFKPHLISKITSGSVGNWKVALNLEKNTSTTEEQEKSTKTYEAREIKKLEGASETDEENKKNLINIIPDTDTNKDLKVDDIFKRVKNHGVRNFQFSEEPRKVSYVYSQNASDRTKESLHILDIRHKNEFGIYMYEKWIPIILSAIFLSGIMFYLYTAFKTPGLLMGLGLVASVVNVAGVFFALGSKMSLIGLSAAFVGVFYALFLCYYSLGFLKKIFNVEFLDKSNVWVVFKRGIVLATDISLPLFTFSTFLAFLAPLHLREFGIVLSLFILISYLFVSVVGSLMSLQYVNKNFFKSSQFFKKEQDKPDYLLKICDKCLSSKRNITYSVCPLVGLVVIATTLLFFLGFNSFSFFKDNSLITFGSDSWALKTGKSISDVSNEIEKLGASNYRVLGKGDVSGYLVKGSENLSSIKSKLEEVLNTGAWYISPTQSFGDWATAQDLAKAISFSFLLISLYVFIRFRFKNLFILLCNSLTSFALLISFLLVFRITVYSSIFLAICTFFALSIMYNIVLFSLDRNNSSVWYFPLTPGISNDMYQKLIISIIWFTSSLFVTVTSDFWILSVYMAMTLLISHTLLTYIYFLLFDRLEYIRNKYMWKREEYNSSMAVDHTGAVRLSGEESLDEYDEEIILGINRNF